MKVGDKFEIYVPSALGYGTGGTPTIPPNSTLIFEMELLDILKEDEAAKGDANPHKDNPHKADPHKGHNH